MFSLYSLPWWSHNISHDKVTCEFWQLPKFYLQTSIFTESQTRVSKCLLDISTLTDKYLKLNKIEPNPLCLPTTSVNQFPFSVKENSILRSCLGSNFWSLPSRSSFSHTPILSISKSCWLYLQNICGIWLLLTASQLGSWSKPWTFLLMVSLFPSLAAIFILLTVFFFFCHAMWHAGS